jgi:threonine-phosphate decarboxylase
VQEHGDDGARLAMMLGLDVADVLDLSASLNPVAPDVAALVASLAPTVTRYPDATEATAALAGAIGVPIDRIVLTNGGAEAIALVAAVVGAGHVVDPDFALYRRHLPRVAADAGRWRSNPSSPLGRLADAAEAAAVWDEAFYPLATGEWSRGDADAWRLGSLTKLWACPGLRLGYAIAPTAEQADAVRARQPRWSVSTLAAEVVGPMLDMTDLPRWMLAIGEARRALVAGLRDRGIDADDTDVNWVLVREPDLRRRLARHGVIVRDCSSFGLPGTFRMAVPHPNDLDRVLGAVDALAASRR